MAKSSGTIVEEIASSICQKIFREDYEAGNKLPPLRTLAKQYDVTLPTIQRVIARMEELGVITVRQGSGVTVLDPLTNAHPSAMPYWLEAFREDPPEVARLLGDFLSLRSELAISLLISIRPGVRSGRFDHFEQRLDDFAEAAHNGMSIQEAFDTDFGLMRAVLKLEPQLAYSTILNIFHRLISSMPELMEALYNPPSRNAEGYKVVFNLMKDGSMTDDDIREQVGATLKLFDKVSLAKFEAILDANLKRERKHATSATK